MSFNLDTPYYRIPGSQSEATFGTIMEMLLKTRLKLHLEDTARLNDEDVNTYLAGLLVSYFDSKYLHAISEVLTHYDFEVFQKVGATPDRAHVYWIYKVNADDLLVSLGIFRVGWKEAKGDLMKLKRYYTCASHYQRRMYGKSTAVAEIQSKLSDRTERYLTILEEARRDYLNFMEHLRPEEMTIFQDNLQSFEKELPLKTLYDELLDSLSDWIEGDHAPELRQKIAQMLENIKLKDKNFQPELFQNNFFSLP